MTPRIPNTQETSIKATCEGVVRKVGSGLVKQGRVIKEGMGVCFVEAGKAAQAKL